MKKNILFSVIIFFAILDNCIGADNINVDDINAKYVILMDYDTDEILYQKNINDITAPSSMTKMMTAYVIFDMLENGEININDKF
jgi:D-alanyl-D-alanine carboxypeptidase (penicillin-binding protein 5/6)